jgi:hypothetical protein
MLPGVSTDGLVAVTVQQGSIQRLDFEYFQEYVLVGSAYCCDKVDSGKEHLVLMQCTFILTDTILESIPGSEKCNCHGQLQDSPWRPHSSDL